MVQIPHDYPVTHLAIDAEKGHLACIQELGTVIVWDISTKMKMAVFHIPNQGLKLRLLINNITVAILLKLLPSIIQSELNVRFD